MSGKNQRSAVLATELMKNLLVAADLGLDKIGKHRGKNNRRENLAPLVRTARHALEKSRLERQGADLRLRFSSSGAELEKIAEFLAEWLSATSARER
jgi:hypothetical protein